MINSLDLEVHIRELRGVAQCLRALGAYSGGVVTKPDALELLGNILDVNAGALDDLMQDDIKAD